MRSLYERIGGHAAVAAVVDDFYRRLTTDPRVLHHFDPERLPSLRAAQVAWLTATLGSDPDAPRADLAHAHRNVTITGEQVTAVLGHLEASLATAGVDEELRRQVMSVVSRLWYARVF